MQGQTNLTELIKAIRAEYSQATALRGRERDDDCQLPDLQQQFAMSIYSRLYRTATRILGPQKKNETPTLGPTAIVNECFVKMLKARIFQRLESPEQFFCEFAIAVKHVMISYWRKSNTQKRGLGLKRLDFEIVLDYACRQNGDLIAVSDAMDELNELHPRAGKALHMRFFSMMKVQEIADAMSVSKSTVESDLRMARAFVRAQLLEA